MVGAAEDDRIKQVDLEELPGPDQVTDDADILENSFDKEKLSSLSFSKSRRFQFLDMRDNDRKLNQGSWKSSRAVDLFPYQEKPG